MPMVRTLSTACKRPRQGDAPTRGSPDSVHTTWSKRLCKPRSPENHGHALRVTRNDMHETASRDLLGIMRRTPLLTPHAAMIDLALAYNARPAADLPPTGMKPVTPNAFRAAFTASIQALMVLL